MAEPVIPTASAIVGIIVPALHITRILRDDIKRIKDATQEIKDLSADIDSYTDCLELLQSVQQQEWDKLGAEAADKTQKAVRSREDACTGFHTQLKEWTKHSDPDGKLSRRDRFQIGFFEKEQIKVLQRQLQSGKASLNNTVAVAGLYVSLAMGTGA
jgi:type I site-specific restriction endonuclease